MRRHGGIVVGLGLLLLVLTGCQTWIPEAGLTMPTGRYMHHPAQYFPPSPPFPLPRELAAQEAAQAAAPQVPGAALPVAPAAPLGGQ
jgi:hypothetical protein